MADACFHCEGSGQCVCILCAKEAQAGWKPGPCVACKARKKWDRFRPILEQKNIDPRDAKWWRTDRSGTGGFRRIFTPEEEFSAILKTRDEL